MLSDVRRLYGDMRHFAGSYLGDWKESSFAKVGSQIAYICQNVTNQMNTYSISNDSMSRTDMKTTAKSPLIDVVVNWFRV